MNESCVTLWIWNQIVIAFYLIQRFSKIAHEKRFWTLSRQWSVSYRSKTRKNGKRCNCFDKNTYFRQCDDVSFLLNLTYWTMDNSVCVYTGWNEEERYRKAQLQYALLEMLHSKSKEWMWTKFFHSTNATQC